MAEVVRYAGGLLFDRVMAGWDAVVLTADHADSRPVRILGASALDLDSALATPGSAPRPEAIAVAAGIYGSDVRVRRMVQELLDQRSSEVRLWGRQGAAGDCALQHRLSIAARAFKAQALVAAQAQVDGVDVVETFAAAEPGGVPGAVPDGVAVAGRSLR